MFPFMGKEGKTIRMTIMLVKSLMNMHPTGKSYGIRTGKRSLDKFARIQNYCLSKKARGLKGCGFIRKSQAWRTRLQRFW